MEEYKIVDIARFFLSLMVISIHCGIESINPRIFNIFQGLVPCFFVISGYLIDKKYEFGQYPGFGRPGGGNSYVRRILKMYVSWLVIYLPLTVYFFINNGYPWFIDILKTIHYTVLIGGNDGAGFLWYLHALIVGAFLSNLIIYKCKIGNEILVLIVILTLLVGYMMEYYVLFNPKSILTKVFYVTIGTTRDGFFQGFPFFTIGILINRYKLSEVFKSKGKKALILILILILLPVASLFHPTKSLFLTPLLCFFVMIYLLSTHVDWNLETKSIREISNWMFFVHIYFHFLFICVLKVEEVFYRTLLVSFFSIILGVFLYRISWNKKRLKQLI